MIRLIALKDFLLNLKSAKFIIGFLICLFIIPFTLVISMNRYNDQQGIYKVETSKAANKQKEWDVYSEVRPEIVRAPEPLSIFSEGISENLGTSATVNFGEYTLFLQGHTTTRDNPFLNAFYSVDFATVIAIVMSLLALVFSYDCFTREREEGTMKAILSNHVSRISFFIGKLLGILLTLLPILVFCYLLSILFVVLSPNVAFNANAWGSLALLFSSSLVYVVVFILMGMFISSLTQRSSTSIIISLLAWIWFLFLMPNIAFYMAQSFSKTGLYDNVRFAMNDIDKEYYKERGDKWQAVQKEMGVSGLTYWNSSTGYDGYVEFSGGPRNTFDFHQRFTPWDEALRIDYADKKWPIQKAYLDGLVQQEHTRQWLATLSPAEIFGQLASALCHTDASAYLNYMENIRTYRETIIRYFKDKKLFESPKYFTAQDPSTFISEERLEKAMEKCKTDNGIDFDQLEKELPEIAVGNGSFPPVNIDDMPVFNYQSAATGNSLNVAMQRLVMLLFIGVVLLVATVVSFRRYKIR